MSIFENQTGRIPRQSTLNRRYLIVGNIGRGGMSAIYQAIDTQSGNAHVAIKEMSQGHLSDAELAEAIARFQQEAQLLHTLQHPNLPRIYNVFEEQGRSFLVMEYIEGKNLLQLLQDNAMRPLPVAEVMNYAFQLCDVLAYLHQHQPPIIFRDLKPTNVMVTANGHIYLIDFGIARFFKEGQAQDTVLLGSPGYAPPEQHGSAQTSPRSDLYSLGATLHCCLTGKDPYLATERFVFSPVRQNNPLVPLELDQLIQRLVAIDERYRPTSALEVQQSLNRIRQHASGDTMQVGPVIPASPASAPTQYAQPQSTAPATISNAYQAPQQPPTVAARSSGSPPISAQGTAQGHPQTSSTSRTWTAPFTAFFVGMLILTGGISLFALNFITNSDHIVEFGLSVLLLFVAIGTTLFVHKFVPLLIATIVALGSLASGVAFLIQATPASTHLIERLQQFISPNNLFTIGLGAATLVLLLWLLRPMTLLNRLPLLILSGGAAICLFVQYSRADANSVGGNEGDIKHTLLLVALILLIQGVLLAARTERVRSRP
ncbi:MAG TPA: protein kinase [Ktedonobacteraceae bacterium]|nr:protein kinase [Ktedonobacteraceae bacterium]